MERFRKKTRSYELTVDETLKTPVLKIKHVEAAQHLSKPVKRWEKVVWSDETKAGLSGCFNTPRVWRTNGPAHHPDITMATVKFRGGNVRAVFQLRCLKGSYN